MKTIIATLVMATTLFGGFFGWETQAPEPAESQPQIHEQFRKNVNDANAIVKRGEYRRIGAHERELNRIIGSVSDLKLSESQGNAIRTNLRQYAVLVNRIGGTLQKNAPELNRHYTDILSGLPEFNRRLASIGLSELLTEWRDLSRIKNRFVKAPSRQLAEAFRQKLASVSVIITELYLDEELEAPLFTYLERYKAYFSELDAAYRSVGYASVARLKPLSYEIKMQLMLSVPRS
jgi:hypothetical protein